MLNGEHVRLRPVQEEDLEELYRHNTNLEARGAHYILDVESLPSLRRRFAENGLWQDDRGTLLIVDHDDRMMGALFFFPRVAYHHWSALEIAYRLFDPAFAGRGVMTEALNLLCGYLFAATTISRLEVVVLPENVASRRVAEKCGFVYEGTARRAFVHGGRAVDIDVLARVRPD